MEGNVGAIIGGLIIALVLGLIIGGITTIFVGIDISQETADEICVNLTGIKGTFAEDEMDVKGGLVSNALYCKTPTWDETSNIIIQSNSED